jgi:hypothetical protein
MRRDACGIRAVLKVQSNQPVALDMSGDNSCDAVVTFDKDGVVELGASSLKTEAYGPDTTVCFRL